MAEINPELWQQTYSLQKESQLRRLKDSTSSLLEQYGELLRSGQLHSGAVERQAASCSRRCWRPGCCRQRRAC